MNRYRYVVSGGSQGRRTTTSDEPYHSLVEGTNLETGEEALSKIFGRLTSIEADLLRVASAVFAADRASLRGERENLTRDIALTVPVANLDRLLPMKHALERLIRDLSTDIWNLRFIAKRASGADDVEDETPASNTGKTLLFSGGLDSLAAAIEFSDQANSLLLVSHRTRNRATEGAQTKLAEMLRASGRQFGHIQVFVSSRDGGPTNLAHAVEPTQRTRSFVFLVIAAICARRSGHSEVLYMAENGQMAIHLPLTSARIGAFSTRTAHPRIIAAAEAFLREMLGFNLKVHNPYVYLTKAEVVARIIANMPTGLPVSTSCWKNARITVANVHHCGACVPCIMRRIAIEANMATDPTAYLEDAFAASSGGLPSNEEARRNLADISEFAQNFQKLDTDSVIMEYPDLLAKQLDSAKAVEMYRRFADETTAVLSRYQNLQPFLS